MQPAALSYSAPAPSLPHTTQPNDLILRPPPTTPTYLLVTCSHRVFDKGNNFFYVSQFSVREACWCLNNLLTVSTSNPAPPLPHNVREHPRSSARSPRSYFWGTRVCRNVSAFTFLPGLQCSYGRLHHVITSYRNACMTLARDLSSGEATQIRRQGANLDRISTYHKCIVTAYLWLRVGMLRAWRNTWAFQPTSYAEEPTQGSSSVKPSSSSPGPKLW